MARNQHYLRRYVYRGNNPPHLKYFYRKCGILIDMGEDLNTCLYEGTKTPCRLCKIFQRTKEIKKEAYLERHLGYRAKP